MTTCGWRAAFYLCGAIGIVVALLWYALVADRPADHSWVNQAELEYSLNPRRASRSRPLLDVSCCGGAIRGFLRLAFGYVLHVYLSWFYLYLVHELKFSVTHGGFYAMPPFYCEHLR